MRRANQDSVVGMPLHSPGSHRTLQQRVDAAVALTARDELRTTAHDEAILPALAPLDVVHLPQVHQQGPLDLDEAERCELLRQGFQGRARQVAVGAQVGDDIVAR